ncbi:hypothetical protein [Agarivorans sp. 1_MG-2023]|uniref:hypothetical protein n=1 Tax=Agarivorans sp. 1_MG-2023 TaxID=3062634 RepID=UPI0026E2F77B|nr:hypothetical protein [Agarivorans sp. 1_MG-2023]MDO6762350.1 hypothetical protein [Agarivorans sp. 1_MG-2023]
MNSQNLNKSIRQKTTIIRALLAAMVIMLMLSLSVQANEVDPQTGEEYAMVVAKGKLLSLTKWKVEVDFGQALEIGIKNKDLLRDRNGKVIAFNSPMAALNHLNQSGWVLVSANTSGDQFSAIMKRDKPRAE